MTVFIRRRHPQLKTGSINLCMTDVCVQARRVANNQRSRQHPVRLGKFPDTTTSTSGVPSPEPSTQSSGANGGSLLGLKDRNVTTVTMTETTIDLSIPVGLDMKPLFNSHCSAPNLVGVDAWNKPLLTESRVTGFGSQDWAHEKLNSRPTPMDDATSYQIESCRSTDHDPASELKASSSVMLSTMGTDADTIEESS
ncbi:hypothetical protein FGIG_06881 [Fasciola gigantica]|uniref:Uncharacterized protein n=1 Tax=Fasciola gigantica TaxID=46835 RepID=A0A504Y2G9_FASGI|nr:hypothetical protein FGIG_06881 [Fasciola gigantica]